MLISDKVISKSTIVQMPIDKVWQCWTTHEGLLTFFGADNNIDLTPGGAFEIYFLMDNPYGLRGSEGCKVLSLLPERMLSFSWNASPQYLKVRSSDYKAWVVVEFVSITENQTKVMLTHLGWPQDDEWTAVYDYFDKAWETVLENFKKSVSD